MSPCLLLLSMEDNLYYCVAPTSLRVFLALRGHVGDIDESWYSAHRPIPHRQALLPQLDSCQDDVQLWAKECTEAIYNVLGQLLDMQNFGEGDHTEQYNKADIVSMVRFMNGKVNWFKDRALTSDNSGQMSRLPFWFDPALVEAEQDEDMRRFFSDYIPFVMCCMSASIITQGVLVHETKNLVYSVHYGSSTLLHTSIQCKGSTLELQLLWAPLVNRSIRLESAMPTFADDDLSVTVKLPIVQMYTRLPETYDLDNEVLTGNPENTVPVLHQSRTRTGFIKKLLPSVEGTDYADYYASMYAAYQDDKSAFHVLKGPPGSGKTTGYVKLAGQVSQEFSGKHKALFLIVVPSLLMVSQVYEKCVEAKRQYPRMTVAKNQHPRDVDGRLLERDLSHESGSMSVVVGTTQSLFKALALLERGFVIHTVVFDEASSCLGSFFSNTTLHPKNRLYQFLRTCVTVAPESRVRVFFVDASFSPRLLHQFGVHDFGHVTVYTSKPRLKPAYHVKLVGEEEWSVNFRTAVEEISESTEKNVFVLLSSTKKFLSKAVEIFENVAGNEAASSKIHTISGNVLKGERLLTMNLVKDFLQRPPTGEKGDYLVLFGTEAFGCGLDIPMGDAPECGMKIFISIDGWYWDRLGLIGNWMSRFRNTSTAPYDPRFTVYCTFRGEADFAKVKPRLRASQSELNMFGVHKDFATRAYHKPARKAGMALLNALFRAADVALGIDSNREDYGYYRCMQGGYLIGQSRGPLDRTDEYGSMKKYLSCLWMMLVTPYSESLEDKLNERLGEGEFWAHTNTIQGRDLAIAYLNQHIENIIHESGSPTAMFAYYDFLTAAYAVCLQSPAFVDPYDKLMSWFAGAASAVFTVYPSALAKDDLFHLDDEEVEILPRPLYMELVTEDSNETTTTEENSPESQNVMSQTLSQVAFYDELSQGLPERVSIGTAHHVYADAGEGQALSASSVLTRSIYYRQQFGESIATLLFRARDRCGLDNGTFDFILSVLCHFGRISKKSKTAYRSLISDESYWRTDAVLESIKRYISPSYGPLVTGVDSASSVMAWGPHEYHHAIVNAFAHDSKLLAYRPDTPYPYFNLLTMLGRTLLYVTKKSLDRRPALLREDDEHRMMSPFPVVYVLGILDHQSQKARSTGNTIILNNWHSSHLLFIQRLVLTLLCLFLNMGMLFGTAYGAEMGIERFAWDYIHRSRKGTAFMRQRIMDLVRDNYVDDEFRYEEDMEEDDLVEFLEKLAAELGVVSPKGDQQSLRLKRTITTFISFVSFVATMGAPGRPVRARKETGFAHNWVSDINPSFHALFINALTPWLSQSTYYSVNSRWSRSDEDRGTSLFLLYTLLMPTVNYRGDNVPALREAGQPVRLFEDIEEDIAEDYVTDALLFQGRDLGMTRSLSETKLHEFWEGHIDEYTSICLDAEEERLDAMTVPLGTKRTFEPKSAKSACHTAHVIYGAYFCLLYSVYFRYLMYALRRGVKKMKLRKCHILQLRAVVSYVHLPSLSFAAVFRSCLPERVFDRAYTFLSANRTARQFESLASATNVESDKLACEYLFPAYDGIGFNLQRPEENEDEGFDLFWDSDDSNNAED